MPTKSSVSETPTPLSLIATKRHELDCKRETLEEVERQIPGLRDAIDNLRQAHADERKTESAANLRALRANNPDMAGVLQTASPDYENELKRSEEIGEAEERFSNATLLASRLKLETRDLARELYRLETRQAEADARATMPSAQELAKAYADAERKVNEIRQQIADLDNRAHVATEAGDLDADMAVRRDRLVLPDMLAEAMRASVVALVALKAAQVAEAEAAALEASSEAQRARDAFMVAQAAHCAAQSRAQQAGRMVEALKRAHRNATSKLQDS